MFVDEPWAKTNMTRSPLKRRLVDRVPYGRCKTTFLGAMRSTGFVGPLCVEGAINGTLFQAWVEQHLVQVLRPSDTVVVDNLSSHKGSGVAAAAAVVGAEVATCRLIRRISIRSNSPLASSTDYSAMVPSRPSKSSGSSVDKSSVSTPKPNAATTSLTADTAIFS